MPNIDDDNKIQPQEERFKPDLGEEFGDVGSFGGSIGSSDDN